MSADGRVSKQEWAYGVLRERILHGAYGPGHRLVIDALAREMEVSQMPLREAIRRLEAEGWVIFHANHGAEVAPLDEAGWTETMTTLAVLEGYATAQSAPHLRRKDIRGLRAINRRMRAALDDLDLTQVSEHNNAFHAAICAGSENGYLRRQMEAASERLESLRRTTIFVFIPARGHVSADEHEHLLDLVQDGAPAAEIERHAREHKLHTVRAYEERRAAAAG